MAASMSMSNTATQGRDRCAERSRLSSFMLPTIVPSTAATPRLISDGIRIIASPTVPCLLGIRNPAAR